MTENDEKPKFVGGPARSEAVPLTYPVEFRGIVYSEIQIHRLTVADIEAHANRYSALQATDPAAAEKLRLPVFGDTPDEVIAFLDPDDAALVNRAVEKIAVPLSLRSASESPPVSSEPLPSSS